MKIESHGEQRIYFYGKDGFLDIRPIEYMGTEIKVYDGFSYWAVVKTKDNYEPFSIVFFENKKWFDEWRKNKKLKVIYQRGKIGG